MKALRSGRMMAFTPPLWLVADMDKTLMEKPPPATRFHPPFSMSPAFDPAMRWLRRGGRLCVVTTDDGFRPFQKLWNDIPVDARTERRVVLATSDGAAIFYGDDHGELEEDTVYASRKPLTLDGNGTPLRLPSNPRDMEELLNACRRLYIQVVEDMATDTRMLDKLSGQVRESYEGILAALDEVGSRNDPDVAKERRLKLEEILSIDALIRPGEILSGSTMIWRNQAGPMNAWVRDGTKTGPFFGYYAKEGEQPSFTNLFLMALPKNLSAPYIEKDSFVQTLKEFGLAASAAPNSVCVRSAAVGKDLPVKYLAENPAFGLQLNRIVAFGDNPLGNDWPLAALPAPFVSVAPEWQGPVPPDFKNGGFYHVGGCETGTAAVLERLLQELEKGDVSELEILQRLPDICAEAAASLSKCADGKPCSHL